MHRGLRPVSLADMNAATRLELTVANMLLVQAIDMLEPHHDPEDVDAAVKAALVRALEVACNRPLRPLEELFEDD